MSILVVGAKGNMGKRYKAILKFIGKDFVEIDQEHNRHYAMECARRSEGIIIATPTATHADVIRQYIPAGRPILCEKPVTKNIPELKSLMDEIKSSTSVFRMIYQYQMLIDRNRIGKCLYNYFKHGDDGLIWDCMQIIGLSRSEPELKETSPIWTCIINGKALSLHDMDAAYIYNIQHWLKNPHQDPGEIIAVHEKTAEMAKRES